jgi:hypothetical protein
MSRVYRIRLKESIVRTVHVQDGVKAALELLPVLEKPRMAELLAAELVARGFTRRGGQAVRVEPDGVELVVDLADATVTARASTTTTVEAEIERSASVVEERRESGEAELKKAMARELGEHVERERARLAAEVTARLERRLVDVKAELDQVVNKVTVRALEQRAAELGQVESVVADEHGGVTIKVRL